MKKNILIIIFVFFTMKCVTSQITGVYKFVTNEYENIEYTLWIYGNKTYELYIDRQETEDIIESLIVSFGSYNLVDDSLTLVDKYNGFKQKLFYNNNYVTFENSFVFLSKKEFYKKKYKIYDIPQNNLSISLDSIVQNHNKMNCSDNVLTFGTYYDGVGFEINVLRDGKYFVRYHNVVISDGVWSRNRNVLIFHDLALKHNFYSLIQKGNIVNYFTPFVLKKWRIAKYYPKI